MPENYHELMQELRITKSKLTAAEAELDIVRAQLKSVVNLAETYASVEPSDAELLAHQTLPTVNVATQLNAAVEAAGTLTPAALVEAARNTEALNETGSVDG